MSNRWRKGGILAEFREDGTLHIYAPDDSRVMSSELAADLAAFLAEGLGLKLAEPLSPEEAHTAALLRLAAQEYDAPPSETVPSGEITTTKRRPGRPRKAQP